MFRELFENLVNLESTKGDLSVFEVNNITNNHEEMLTSQLVVYDEVIRFSAVNGSVDNQSNLNMPGCCIFYRVGEEVYTVVFIKKDVVEDNLENNNLWKYMILVHEIGHANDFRKSKYTNWKRNTCDLVKAEAFAEIFSLKYFSKRNDIYHRECRRLASSRILDFTDYDDKLYSSVFFEIQKTYSRGRLLSWAA